MWYKMWYKLDGKVPVLCADVIEYFKWAATQPEKTTRVAHTMAGDVRISTVFLGLDHSWNGPPPIVFETMIFGGPLDDYQERYSTWDDAVIGHRRAVDKAKQAMTDA